MAIEKRVNAKGTSYRFRVTLGRDHNGKQIFKYKTYVPTNTAPSKIEKEVQSAYSEFERQVLTGSYFDDKLTFSEFYDTWLKEYGIKQLTPNEYEGNIATMKQLFLPAIGHLPMTHIKGIHIQMVINDLEKRGLKPSTIQKVFSRLSTVFTRAYKLELIENNPCKRVTLPRNIKDNEIHAFTISQAETFLNACENGITIHHKEIKRKNGRVIPANDEHLEIQFQFLVYFTLAIYSGFRRGEMIGLQWKNIDYKNQLITIDHATSSAKMKNGQFDKSPKTKAGNRTISLPVTCFILLKRLQADQDAIVSVLGDAWKGNVNPDDRYIFTQADGSQMHLSTPSHKFKEIINAYNSTVPDSEKLPLIHLHDLRHTSASILISSNIDIATVARRLGHSDIAVTLNTYTHALPDIDVTASNALEQAFHSRNTLISTVPENQGHTRVTNLQTGTHCDPKIENEEFRKYA